VLAAGKTVGVVIPAGLRLMRSFSPGFGPKAHDVICPSWSLRIM
jgi:hypothetical protein